MLKKTLSLILATALACSAGSALALNYSGSQGNEATFELLEEARVSAPAAVQHLELNESKTFVSFPVLVAFPRIRSMSTAVPTSMAAGRPAA